MAPGLSPARGSAMSYPHVIRLRGPWDYQPLVRYVPQGDGPPAEETTGLPPPGRMKLPADWGEALGGEFRGRVRYLRRFNRPSGLESRERVWLVTDGADARAQVHLNGHLLGEIAGYALPARFDVTENLSQRNELAIEVEAPAAAALRPGREDQPGGLIREVRLEIQHRLSLHGLAVWADVGEPPLLHIQGSVLGEPTSPINLLVSGMSRELGFEPVQEQFDLTVEVPNLPTWSPGSPGSTEAINLRLLHGGEAVWEATLATASRGSTSAELPPGVVWQDEIATSEQYAQFDRQGIAVIQTVPLAWAKEVCPRIAHQPSIIAWTAAEGESAELPSGERYGRPWVGRSG